MDKALLYWILKRKGFIPPRKLHRIDLSDEIILSDWLLKALVELELLDEIDVYDLLSESSKYVRLTDELILSDYLWYLLKRISLEDSLSISDSLTIPQLPYKTIQLEDSLSLSDSLVKELIKKELYLTDSIDLYDRLSLLRRSINLYDSINVSDRLKIPVKDVRLQDEIVLSDEFGIGEFKPDVVDEIVLSDELIAPPCEKLQLIVTGRGRQGYMACNTQGDIPVGIDPQGWRGEFWINCNTFYGDSYSLAWIEFSHNSPNKPFWLRIRMGAYREACYGTAYILLGIRSDSRFTWYRLGDLNCTMLNPCPITLQGTFPYPKFAIGVYHYCYSYPLSVTGARMTSIDYGR